MRVNDPGGWNLIRTIDPCLPPRIRDNSALPLEELIRSRVLTSLLISSSVMLLISLVTLVVSWFISSENFVTPVAMTVSTLVLVVLNGWFFYQTGRVNSAAVLFSLTTFISCVVTIILTGGYESPVMPILTCIPVFAFLIGGRQEGIYNAILTYVTATVLLILHGLGFPMMQLLPEEVKPYLAGIVWFVTMGVIIICLYIYDVLLEETRTTIVNKGSNRSP